MPLRWCVAASLTLVLISVTSVCLVAGLSYNVTVLDDESLARRIGPRFGFLQGGSLDVLVKTDYKDRPLMLAVLSEGQRALMDFYSLYKTSAAARHDICTAPSYFRQQFVQVVNVSIPIRFTDRFSTYVIQCYGDDEENLSFLANMHFANPGGQELPLEEIPLISASVIETVLYLVILYVWFGFLAIQRPVVQPAPRITTTWSAAPLVSIVLAMRAAASVLSMIQYLSRSAGSDSVILFVCFIVFDVLADVLLVILIVLLSMGWGVIKPRIVARREHRTLAVFFIFYLVCNASRQACDPVGAFCPLWHLVFWMIRFVVIFGSAIVVGGRIEHMHVDAHESWRPSQQALMLSKLGALQQIRSAMMYYALLPVLFAVLDVTMLNWQQAWFTVIIGSLMTMHVTSSLAYALRPRIFRSDTSSLLASMLHSQSPRPSTDASADQPVTAAEAAAAAVAEGAPARAIATTTTTTTTTAAAATVAVPSNVMGTSLGYDDAGAEIIHLDMPASESLLEEDAPPTPTSPAMSPPNSPLVAEDVSLLRHRRPHTPRDL